MKRNTKKQILAQIMTPALSGGAGGVFWSMPEALDHDKLAELLAEMSV